MTQEEILRMARDSGMSFHLGMPHQAVMDQLSRFAVLVRNDALDAAANFIEGTSIHARKDAEAIRTMKGELK